MRLVEILEAGNVALGVLQARLLTIMAMLGAFGLFAWSMWLQTTLGVIIASAWGLLVFLPVLFHDRGVTHGLSETQEHADSAPRGGGRPRTEEPDGS